MVPDGDEPVRRVSSFYLAIILVTFILSLIALYIALGNMVNQTDLWSSYSFFAVGLFGLALSGYLLMQTRSKPVQKILELPRVLTMLECPNCDFKNVRDFQKGDYIFKENGSCQKCDNTMKITGIYREAKKKDKE
jgi:hypothetical protein